MFDTSGIVPLIIACLLFAAICSVPVLIIMLLIERIRGKR